MCLPWCCWRFVDVELEEPKKKEEKAPKRYIMVEDGAVFYPTAEPHTAPVIYQPQYYHPQPVAVPKAPSPKPKEHVYWYGSTREEVDAQNEAIHRAHAKPIPLVPYKPSPDQQFYCRELDNSYSLRSPTDIEENCKPGYWQMGSEGYPYFIRQKG
ncbi:hypothetical protein MMC13_002154 [Lambiella insularis]|nr:hypothetical protein [Lambiella insularis]